ncbi:MAG: DUF4326 domain-containing protein [Propionibacteriaceae bacterium]|jgi:hypothetical protein|nr:DUF4326 domain-containing protein [Propionibacteriaceae bacterium]
MITRRIEMSRRRPWRADCPDAVAVGRRTVFGNPFAPWRQGGGHRVAHLPRHCLWDSPDAARAACVDVFRAWLFNRPARLQGRAPDGLLWGVDGFDARGGVLLDAWGREVADLSARWRALHARLPELWGRDLACWCPLGAPCHADVLIEAARRRGCQARTEAAR